ncbi:hypothetical protein [Marichromatium gracile]|uniref:Uncharacterized protein n=1 Tax=Marichromatium gracile TaxID=1048 RepID=A0ABR5VLQ2_MARGR|nr:hypothetical protein [Marichromatium gracile]KXX66464.1 hypothetical protein AY586_00665 [Marichromatium gracile]
MRSIGTLAFPSPEPLAAPPCLAAHCTATVVSARAGTDETGRTLLVAVDVEGVTPERDTDRDDIRALGIGALEDLTGDAP